MTEPFNEYDDHLRRILNAEAEAVVPSSDGLELIRSKINKRRERRLGLWYATPWLRPLAAVGAAVCIAIAAVSATPALKNFVETGHFSTDSPGDNGRAVPGGGVSVSESGPGGSMDPSPSVSPSLSTLHPSKSGKHAVKGSCPPGEVTVTPSNGTVPSPRATLTCAPEQPTSAPSTPEVPTTPPATPPPDSPSSDPASGGAEPSVMASP
jgi:hypothetical protein